METQNEELTYPLTEVKEGIKKWLYLPHPDDLMIDVILATVIANLFNTDPTWTLIIGPPSSAKTEVLRTLDGLPAIHFLSNLTPSTLVSGILPKGQNEDPSLIYKIDGKIIVLKDFTTILSMRSEPQGEILAQFREIYDGQYTKAFGNGKVVNWNGKVGLIGACTPVYDKHYSVIGSLGDRFILYRTETTDKTLSGRQAQRIVGHEEEMREEIKKAVHNFIGQFAGMDNIHLDNDPALNKMIVALACFCAYARCPVERNYRSEIEYLPMPEGTPRLVKQFMQIGMAMAIIHGKSGIDAEIYEIIKKIGRDLVSTARLKILKYLWDAEAIADRGGWQVTKKVSRKTEIPGTTAKRHLEDRMVVGLLKQDRADASETAP